MKVPSFSNEDAAGRNTVATSRAVSLKNRSCTTTSSSAPSASRVRLPSGLVRSTSYPMA
jgi:hypothetical protein